MNFTENEFRDFLFSNYKNNLSTLIFEKKEPIKWLNNGFPPIHFLLQQKAEKKINELIHGIETLILSAKELRLEKEGDSTTRVDLFGCSECNGLTIIELKKSKQTERQTFTELLAYANHFCSIFPGLKESAITSILIAPMESRTVRDAYVQELIINNKNVLALIPEEKNKMIKLRVYYPDKSYYQWFENNLLNDWSMTTVAISFPVIEGWIDADSDSSGRKIPAYSRDALNTVSSAISHRLEASSMHSLVYASQIWGEIAQIFPYPNTIFIATINPFSSFRTSIHENKIYGESEKSRLANVQSIYNQLSENEKAFWLDTMETSFRNNLIEIVKNEFDLCFKNTARYNIDAEISNPNWYGIKNSMIDAVYTHNLDIFLTGLLRDIYLEYIKYVYETGEQCIFYGSDLPKYSYKTLRDFFPVWEILSRLGFCDER